MENALNTLFQTLTCLGTEAHHHDNMSWTPFCFHSVQLNSPSTMIRIHSVLYHIIALHCTKTLVDLSLVAIIKGQNVEYEVITTFISQTEYTHFCLDKVGQKTLHGHRRMRRSQVIYHILNIEPVQPLTIKQIQINTNKY